MKSLAKVFVSFLLAISIAFGGFSDNAHAQFGANTNVPIDPNKTIDQILGLITTTQQFQIVVANQTGETLSRVGAYNDLSNWTLGDVPASTAQYRDWRESGAGYFSFAANYAVGNTGKYFQFGVAYPPIGRRKINLCSVNSPGNSPARKCWDSMSDASDKNQVNGQFTGRAILGNQNGRIQWVYQVK
jgi:hypothetical protein